MKSQASLKVKVWRIAWW